MNRSYTRRAAPFGVCLFALVLGGCPSTNLYRTARTLEPGEGDFSLGFSATRIAQSDYEVTDPDSGATSTQEGASVAFPNLVPDLSGHVGVADNVEVGGRVGLGSLLVELDTKLRVVGDRESKTHVAVQPALGYRSAIIVEGYSATLPLIFTHDINSKFSVNVSPFVSYTSYNSTDEDVDVNLEGDALSVGGSLGFQIRGETFHIMPAIEMSKTATTFDDGDNDVASADITYVTFGVTFGWVLGREKQQLDRIERKLDDLGEKLDRDT